MLLIGNEFKMKSLIRYILGIVNKMYLILINRNYVFFKNEFYLTKILVPKLSKASIKKTVFEKSSVLIEGGGNKIICDNSFVSNTNIKISGKNNLMLLESQVKLRNAEIIIRGSNCAVKISAGTTFGGVRIVNVGKENLIQIGKNCLFSDNIEIWASDTHSIYDSTGNFINPEKPIIIEDNVWVGSHVKILKGVTIGEGSIIGMNSLITKDIMPKTLNIGNPSRCIKQDVSWTLDYKNEKD